MPQIFEERGALAIRYAYDIDVVDGNLRHPDGGPADQGMEFANTAAINNAEVGSRLDRLAPLIDQPVAATPFFTQGVFTLFLVAWAYVFGELATAVHSALIRERDYKLFSARDTRFAQDYAIAGVIVHFANSLMGAYYWRLLHTVRIIADDGNVEPIFVKQEFHPVLQTLREDTDELVEAMQCQLRSIVDPGKSLQGSNNDLFPFHTYKETAHECRYESQGVIADPSMIHYRLSWIYMMAGRILAVHREQIEYLQEESLAPCGSVFPMQDPVDLTWSNTEEADYLMEHANHRELVQLGLMEYQRMHMRFSKQICQALRFHERPAVPIAAVEQNPSITETGII